jgi:hypothetical protein
MSRRSPASALPCLALLVAACGPSSPGDGDGDGGGDGVDAPTGPCVGLACQQVTCPGGGTTSLSGTVYTPAGDLPLPNVIVFVPNAPLAPITEGVSCDTCDAQLSGSPLVLTRTDATGRFTLTHVPVGDAIPLVMQVGKWRRQVSVPVRQACADTALTDPDTTRLPRNRAEGDLPRIALTTGEADALECLLRKIGIDDAEFTPESGPGRVNLFAGHDGVSGYAASLHGGAPFTPASPWWDRLDNLRRYDVILHSCDGWWNVGNKSEQAMAALEAFTDLGGRVFASHWHNYWFRHGTPGYQSVATWTLELPHLPEPATVHIDTSFEKGEQLATWLHAVGGSPTYGQLSIYGGRSTVASLDPAIAQRWIYSTPPERAQYFTFNTPIAADPARQCGRVVFSDLHVSSGGVGGTRFPEGCTAQGLTPQEMALVYMIFDLSACVVPDVL